MVRMLDLGFVRANLPLWRRAACAGDGPAAVLGDFERVDRERREAITQAETLKAQRNELDGRDCEAAEGRARMRVGRRSRTKALKAEGEALEEQAAAADVRLRELMQSVPESAGRIRCRSGKSEHDNRGGEGLGGQAAVSTSLPCLTGRLASGWGFWISSARPRSRGRGLWCSSGRGRGWSGRWRTSCWTSIRGSMGIRRCCRRTW